MAIEHAIAQAAPKPWGVANLQPWSNIDARDEHIGELRFQRTTESAPIPALLLKLLFTNEPLSIQVHPGDEFARAIGLPNGKTEAWYILAACAGAQVALGLERNLTPLELRTAIKDGSIAKLTHWRAVTKGDVIFVPAGTIHAIGAGLVLAEIQQRSDTTFRLFDYGRPRELHENDAIAVSNAKPAPIQPSPRRLTAERTVLIASPHFVLERVVLSASSNWALDAKHETWILVIEGRGMIGSIDVSIGDAIFAEADGADVQIGPSGMSALIAYPGPDPIMSLLQESKVQITAFAGTSTRHPPELKKHIEVQP